MAQVRESSHKDLYNIFDNLIGNIKLVLEQLKDGESSRADDASFTLENYWKKLEAVFKSVSHEATKTSVAFSSPPLPSAKDCEILMAGIEKSMLALVSVFYSLPKTQGLSLRKSTKSAVISVIEGIQMLVEIVMEDGVGCTARLNGTGNVWQCCDRFADLPKDNKQATLQLLQETSSLIKDAHGELEEALEGDGQWDDLDNLLADEGHPTSNEDTWSDSDHKFVSTSVGLFKATKSCIKKMNSAIKSNANCDSLQNISQLDDLADHLHKMSPAVDDLACVMYPPLRKDLAVDHAIKLSNYLKNILEFIKHTHIITEDDASWVQFLTQAVDHNLEKIKSQSFNNT